MAINIGKELINLKKVLIRFNYLFFIILVILNIFSYLFSKQIDWIFIVVSIFALFISSIPYFRGFSVDNFKLTYFLQGISLIALFFLLSLKLPIFIFGILLSFVYSALVLLYSKSWLHYFIIGILVVLGFFLFSSIGSVLNIGVLKKFYESMVFKGYFYFVGFSIIFFGVIFVLVAQTRNFILSFYKSQLMEMVNEKIGQANKIAQEKAKEAEERYRMSILMKEKQEKIFEMNVNLAKRIKNLKAQLQYVVTELKNMVNASASIILLDKGGFISADYYVDVPLPVVEVFRLTPKSSENIKKFITKVLKNKEIIHINRRKEIIPEGFTKDESFLFLQEISKVTFEVYEVLLVPIVNSLGESMGLFVIFNNVYEGFSDVDKRLAELVGIQAGIIIHNSMLIKKLEDTFYETINAFSSAIEAKDKYTPVLHTYRVGELAYKVALEMGLSEEEAQKIKIAGILHDVGKLAIPDSILAKQGPLTEQEREIIKTHSEEGSKILSKIYFFREKGIHIYVLYHHERIDGKGYPKGLRGREIPLGANIISVADTYDAISTPRPYNKHYASEQKAIEIIKSERGRQFFEEVVDAFFKVLEKEKNKRKTAD